MVGQFTTEQVGPLSDAYRAIDPLEMVPALDLGGARVMTQADAILQYIGERYPDAKLGADTGLDALFAFEEPMALLSGDMHSACWPFFTPERVTVDASDGALPSVCDAVPARVA